jgi:hypothetical protein
MRLLFISLLLFSQLLAPPCFSEEVLVNIESNLPKTVSVDELREYFMLKKSFYANGVKVQIYLFNKDTAVTRNFLLNVLKISPSSYFDMIEGYAASGRGNLPIIVESDTRMVISIAVNRGGLGIVRDAAYAANLNTLKIIEIK